MGITILFQKTKAKIGSLELDASLSETHTGDVEVTEHPRETGTPVIDHARPKLETLTMEAIVSNTPLGRPASPSDATRGGVAYAALLERKNSGELLTIVTAIRTYERMVITSLSVPRTAKDFHGLRFSVSFKEAQLVSSATVVIEPVAKAKKHLEKRHGEEANGATEAKSALLDLADFAAEKGGEAGGVKGINTSIVFDQVMSFLPGAH